MNSEHDSKILEALKRCWRNGEKADSVLESLLFQNERDLLPDGAEWCGVGADFKMFQEGYEYLFFNERKKDWSCVSTEKPLFNLLYCRIRRTEPSVEDIGRKVLVWDNSAAYKATGIFVGFDKDLFVVRTGNCSTYSGWQNATVLEIGA